MLRFSIIRLLVAETAFAAVFIGLLSLDEDGSNVWAALVGGLAVGGLTLLAKPGDEGTILGTGFACVVGLVVGFCLFTPRGCVLYENTHPVEPVSMSLMGVAFAYGYSAYMRLTEP